MRLGGEEKVKVRQSMFLGARARRRRLEVWVSLKKQEREADRVHSSSDPLGPNSREDGMVMCWVRHNQYASTLAAQECGFTETVF